MRGIEALEATRRLEIKVSVAAGSKLLPPSAMYKARQGREEKRLSPTVWLKICCRVEEMRDIWNWESRPSGASAREMGFT